MVEYFWEVYYWVVFDEVEVMVVIGGDGFMLYVLYVMFDFGWVILVYGVNYGMVGFLMNKVKSIWMIL